MRSAALPAGLVLALLGSAVPAGAARTTEAPSVQALASTASSVVHARVLEADTRQDGPRVRTTYTLAPLTTLAGEAPATLTVTLPGGTVGELTVEAHGVPVWTPGDEAVVFVSDGGSVRLDAVFSIEDGLVIDAAERPADQVPATLSALQAHVRAVRPLQAPSTIE